MWNRKWPDIPPLSISGIHGMPPRHTCDNPCVINNQKSYTPVINCLFINKRKTNATKGWYTKDIVVFIVIHLHHNHVT